MGIIITMQMQFPWVFELISTSLFKIEIKSTMDTKDCAWTKKIYHIRKIANFLFLFLAENEMSTIKNSLRSKIENRL